MTGIKKDAPKPAGHPFFIFPLPHIPQPVITHQHSRYLLPCGGVCWVGAIGQVVADGPFPARLGEGAWGVGRWMGKVLPLCAQAAQDFFKGEMFARAVGAGAGGNFVVAHQVLAGEGNFLAVSATHLVANVGDELNGGLQLGGGQGTPGLGVEALMLDADGITVDINTAGTHYLKG